MSAGLAIQYAVIALLVLGSVGVVMHRQFPGLTRRARSACAVELLREGRPAWVRKLGRCIAPRPRITAGACGRCDGCESR